MQCTESKSRIVSIYVVPGQILSAPSASAWQLNGCPLPALYKKKMRCAVGDVDDLLNHYWRTDGWNDASANQKIIPKKHFNCLLAHSLKCFWNYCLQNVKIWICQKKKCFRWLICCLATGPKFLEIGPKKGSTYHQTNQHAEPVFVKCFVGVFFGILREAISVFWNRSAEMFADHCSGFFKKASNLKWKSWLFKCAFIFQKATNLRCSDRRSARVMGSALPVWNPVKRKG